MTDLTRADAVVDTRDMVLVHTFVRREFRLAPALVRRVAPGDRRRAERVAGHLRLVVGFLHHHHTVEDELAWPLLLERVPDELAPVVHLMESQHERLGGLLEEVDRLMPRWSADASGEDRDRLAAVLDEAYVHLVEHLDAEEQRLLPIAARAMSQAEWDRIGDEARRRAPRRDTPLVVGMFEYEGDPEVLAVMLSDMPAPARRLLLWWARRAFRRHALLIHGTATP